MEVTYERALNETWVILPEEVPAEEYACRLLEQNRCRHLLRLERRVESGRTRYAFSVSRGNSLSRMYQISPMSFPELRRMLTGLYQAVEEAESCLLDLGHLVLKPELIFASPDLDHLQFCCHPGYNRDFFLQLRDLMRYCVQKMDHRDQNDTETVYRLLDICEQEYYSFDDLMQEMGKACSDRFVPEGTETETGQGGRVRYDMDFKGGGGAGGEPGGRGNRKPGQGRYVQAKGAGDPGQPDTESSSYGRFRKSAAGVAEEHPQRRKGRWVLPAGLLLAAALFAGIFFWFGFRETIWDWRYAAASLCMIIGAIVCILTRPRENDGTDRIPEAGDDSAREARFRSLPEESRGKESPEQEWRKPVGGTDRVSGRTDSARGGTDSICGGTDSIRDASGREGRGSSFRDNGISGQSERGRSGAGGGSPRSSGTYGRIVERMAPVTPDTELSPETTFLGETTFLAGLQQEASGGPVLVPVKKGKGETVPVKHPPFVIGTLAGEADLILPGRSVSRIHARIEEEDGQYLILDCRSTNGTWVNGIRLCPEERYPLQAGDEIRFADIKMRFENN